MKPTKVRILPYFSSRLWGFCRFPTKRAMRLYLRRALRQAVAVILRRLLVDVEIRAGEEIVTQYFAEQIFRSIKISTKPSTFR